MNVDIQAVTIKRCLDWVINLGGNSKNYNLGDGAFFNNSAGFRTYSAHTFTGSNITGYGTYGGNATSNYKVKRHIGMKTEYYRR